MDSRRSSLGLRSLSVLVMCGVVAGFAMPMIASSLLAQVRHEAPVRLLPALRPSPSEAQPTPASPLVGGAALPIHSDTHPRHLTQGQLRRKIPPPALPGLSAPTVRSRTIDPASPPHETPARHGEPAKTVPSSHATPVDKTGGSGPQASSPSTTSSGGAG